MLDVISFRGSNKNRENKEPEIKPIQKMSHSVLNMELPLWITDGKIEKTNQRLSHIKKGDNIQTYNTGAKKRVHMTQRRIETVISM
jgi:hypothetical protein